jgi:hypothetical protein
MSKELIVRIQDTVPDGVVPLEERRIPIGEEGKYDLGEDFFAEETEEGIRFSGPGLPDEGKVGRVLIRPLGMEGKRSFGILGIRDSKE